MSHSRRARVFSKTPSGRLSVARVWVSTYHNLVDRSLLLIVAATVHLITRLESWQHPMVGDDFLTVRASKMPIRDGSLLENIWLTGSGKWRPITTPVLMWLGEVWGFDISKFQTLNSLLLVLGAWLTGMLSIRIGGNRLTASLVVVVIVLSSFTWMAQTSVYGVMELLALLFVVASAWSAVNAFRTTDHGTRHVLSSVAFMLAASLTHERFVLCSVVLSLAFLLQSSSRQLRRLAWTPMMIPIIYVFSRLLVLDLDPLAGGGESNLRSASGTWIIAHFFDAIKMLLGSHSPTGIFYTPNHPLASLSTRDNLSWVSLLVAGATVVVIVWLGRRPSPQIADNKHRGQTSIVFLLVGLSLASLVPAATVVERIEGRWLLVPQVFLVLAGVTWASRGGQNKQIVRTAVIPIFFCLVAIYYAPNSEDYLRLRDQPSLVMSRVTDAAPVIGPWVLVISQTDNSVPTAWQFGYGDGFTQMRNRPYLTSIATNQRNECPILKRRIPCIVVRLRGTDLPNSVSSVLTRLAPISIWKS